MAESTPLRLTIRPVDPRRRRDVSRFVGLPFGLYRRDRHWIPPLRSAARKALDPRHPFFAHSAGAFFLAERGRRAVGRIAVFENRPYNSFHATRDAFFGYLELEDDAQVAQGLFRAAETWARGRGLERLRGPRALLAPDAGGILVEGFDEPPVIGSPYNPPYYDALIRGQGYGIDTDLLSGRLLQGWTLPERLQRIADRARERGRLAVRHFRTRRELRAIAPQVMALYMRCFVDRLTYYPLSDAEQAMVIDALVALAHPPLIKVILHEKDVVGFLLSYPNIAPALQRCRGRLWPLGWAHILWEKRHSRFLVANGVALDPAHQGLGGNALLYAELSKTGIDHGYRIAELVQVDLLNDRSLADNEAAGVRWVKRHRHYVKPL